MAEDALRSCDKTTHLVWASLGVRLAALSVLLFQAIRTREFSTSDLLLLVLNEVAFSIVWDSLRHVCALVLNQNVHLALLQVQLCGLVIVVSSLGRVPKLAISALLTTAVTSLAIFQILVLDTTQSLLESVAALVYGLTQVLILVRIVCVLH